MGTRREWTAARNMYSDMQKELRQSYGEDINDKIGLYFGMDDKKAKDLFLASHPEVADALDDQQAYVANNQRLLKYYGGLDTLDRYYTGLMYDKLEAKYGSDITDIEGAYYNIYDKAEKKAYLNAHPELKPYWKEKSALKDENLRHVVEFGQHMPASSVPETQDVTPANPTQKELEKFAQPAPQVSFEQWTQVIGQPAAALIQEYWFDNKDLPSALTKDLDYMAEQYGYDNGRAMLQEILMSLPPQ